MRTRATTILGVLVALSLGGAAAVAGCSGDTNQTSGGTAGAGNGNTGGSGNGSGSASGGNGGDGGCIFGNCGPDDGGINEENVCVGQSAEATLAKKPVDIIFIIDNSGSMTDEIIGVQTNINKNFAQIIDSSGIDYRVIMIADHGLADPNESVCIEAPLSTIPAGGCANPPATPGNNPPKFYHFNDTILSTDSWCRMIEYYNQPDNTGSTQVGWKEWLRPDALKVFVEITDDRVSCTASTGQSFNDGNVDATGATAATEFDDALTKLDPLQFGSPLARNYIWYSINGVASNNPVTKAWDPVDPIQTTKCTSAVNAGYGYQHLSVMTGGLRFPLCEIGSYDAVFQAIAQGVIAGSKVSCDFPVPPAPMGQTVDLNTVEVQYTPMSMGSPTKLAKVADVAACAPNSFYLDKATKTVHLCPDACTVVQKDDKAKIDVFFLCEIGGAN